MTHTLHRCGSVESLAGDYTLIAQAPDRNRAALAPALAKAAELLLDVGPTNIGSSKLAVNALLGFDREDFLRRMLETNAVACAFSSREMLKEAVARLKEADLGLSITVSGLTDEVVALAHEQGLRPHSITLSFGILGNSGDLPEEEILELTTMCGHCRIGAGLAREVVRNVASGNRTARQASVTLGKPCTCGIFNVDRAEELVSGLAARQ